MNSDRLTELVRKNDIAELAVHLGPNLNQTNPKGDTPLLIATRLNNKQLVNQLINLGADLNKENHRGTSALTLAIFNAHFDIAKDLFSSGAKLITEKEKAHDSSHLAHTATYKANLSKLKSMLSI